MGLSEAASMFRTGGADMNSDTCRSRGLEPARCCLRSPESARYRQDARSDIKRREVSDRLAGV